MKRAAAEMCGAKLKRANWGTGDALVCLTKAVEDWDAKTGPYLEDKTLSLRKYAACVDIPFQTLGSYVCNDLGKRKVLGTSVGAKPLFNEAEQQFAVYRTSSAKCVDILHELRPDLKRKAVVDAFNRTVWPKHKEELTRIIKASATSASAAASSSAAAAATTATASAAASSSSASVPSGCHIYRRAVPTDILNRALPSLALRVQEHGVSIEAGQNDTKRKQLIMQPDDKIATELLRVLLEKGELDGRVHADMVAIHSLPGCREQRLHFDYDPELCRGKERKPAVALLGLQQDTHLLINCESETFTIVLGPGDIIVFEGDVLHAGAAYTHENTRVHVYLDVHSVPRQRDITWFPYL